MNEQDKQLLLKDLCARLPYGVKVKFYLPLNTHFVIETLRDVEIRNEDILICTTTWNAIKLENCKPYLRPLSSMTEEEKKEYYETMDEYTHRLYPNSCDWSEHTEYSWTIATFDFLNKKMFDYRGLIPMGLGIDCTGLNIYENEKSI